MFIHFLDDLFAAVCAILDIFVERIINTEGKSRNIYVLWNSSVRVVSYIQCDLLPPIHLE